MCIGVPMRVVSDGEARAWCEGGGERAELDMLLVGPQPVGTWVLAFQGSARRVMSERGGRTDHRRARGIGRSPDRRDQPQPFLSRPRRRTAAARAP